MTVDRALHRIEPGERAAAIETIRKALAGERGLVFAYLFGSFAEGGPFHDIDVAIFLDGGEPDVRDRRAFDLAGRLETALRLPVDVVTLNGRPATFRFHACSGEPLLVNDEDRLTQELERTMAEYFDLEPVLRRATREAFAE